MYLCKAGKRRKSIVMTIPIGITKFLELTAGEYMMLQTVDEPRLVIMTKYKSGGQKNGRNNRNPDKRD